MTCLASGHCTACVAPGGALQRMKQLGGMGGVSLASQLIGTGLGIIVALAGGYIVYATLKLTTGLRLDPEEEYEGADLSIHKITATPERESNW